MANPFYTYGQASGNAILPGMGARAENVAAEFQGVQAGFADLATAGVDSGTAGAYVVATPAGQPSSLADGTTVSFRAGNTNSGASTLAVNGIAATIILRPNGSALQPGDITANVWITLSYNANFSAWCLPSSTSVTTYAGTISGAAPVNPATLVAVAGVATSAMPIDAVIAISTAISPTWVGNHTFNGTTTFAGPTTISGTAVVSGPLTVSGITTHSAGVAFTGPASFAGTATVSGVLAVSGTATFSGPTTISGTTTISGPLAISGTATASAPWKFTTITVTGTSSLAALSVSAAATFAGPLSVGGTASFSSQATFTQLVTVLGASGTVVIGKPTNSNPGIAISAPAGTFAWIALAGNGNTIDATDFELFQDSVGNAYIQQNATGGSLNFQTAGATRVAINSSGAIVCNSATGGAQGAGTINAAGYYVNGTNQFQTGSFTGTLTGCTTAPTATFRYVIAGGLAFIYCTAGLQATSNTTSCTITGLPAALTPTNTQVAPCYGIVNNSSNVAAGYTDIAGTTLTFLVSATSGGNGFTASGNKGVNADWSVTYALG